LRKFLQSRWNGDVPFAVILGRDILLHGTAINIVAALLGSFLFVWEAPTALAATVYLLPLPYNMFLYAALWRCTGDPNVPWAKAARVVGLVWLVAVTIV
jgi:hypothetical protein